MIKPFKKEDVTEFLVQSNYIEDERTEIAHEGAEKAWKYIIGLNYLNPKVIRHIHKILMQKLRPDIAGQWRNCDVWIGGKQKRFTGVETIEYQMANFCVVVDQSKKFKKADKNVMAKDCHVMFENYHPFEDGNGRVGRIIYNWHRYQLGLPIHIIQEQEKHEYYLWFR